MTVDVLDPVAGAVGFAEDAVDLEGAVMAASWGEGPVPGQPPPEGPLVGERLGRGRSPVGESATVVGDPPVDQAVFDAEFAAMMLTEAPWSEPVAGPATAPPRAATGTGTRQAPTPRSPADHSVLVPRTRTATGVLREARRRPGPGPRSPPRNQARPVIVAHGEEVTARIHTASLQTGPVSR